MNEEEQRQRFIGDKGKTTGGTVSTRLPLVFRFIHGGKTQRSAINHQSVLTRMIFALVSCLFLSTKVSCASVEIGSHSSPITSHFIPDSILRHSNVINNNSSPTATLSQNGPLEDHSSGRSARGLQSRQVSTSEWIFSSLVQQSDSRPSSSGQPQTRSQNSRGAPSLSYRSIPMNVYTNYYRNPNIYAQAPRHIDGGNKQSQNKKKYSSLTSQGAGGSSGETSVDADIAADLGLNRRRASSSIPLANELNRMSSVTVPSKLPEVLSERETGTTGLSRTAPATDPSLFVTDRPTSTQEMQISNVDESSTLSDEDIQLDSRAEIGRPGRKRGREMNEDAVSFQFESNSNSPIVFPGSSTDATAYRRGTVRPISSRAKSGDSMATFNPFESHILDGWKRIHELRKKSQSYDGRKSSVASDQSADAKIISLLTIEGVPKCADRDGYCEDIESYPRSFLNQVLNRTLSSDIFQDIFGETTDNNSVVTDVEFKLRHDFEEIPLCSVREHTIYPKAAQNRKGKFMYIVNHDEYLQGIRVETCTRENEQCMFTEGHLPGYLSTCKQKFIYKKLLAFTPEGKAMPDTFRLPSCCVCHVKSMFISDRINPATDLGSSDAQPTLAADDSSWNPSSTTLTYPHRDDTFLPSSSPPSPAEPDHSITFATTAKNDLPNFQVPSPTTSTSSSQLPPQQTGDKSALTQRWSARQIIIFIVVLLLLSFLLRL